VEHNIKGKEKDEIKKERKKIIVCFQLENRTSCTTKDVYSVL
jgi:hypothetical protein